MNDFENNFKLDRRDEMILMIVAFVTPLAILPVMLGLY